MTGLGILFIGGIAVLFAVVAVVVMRAEDRRDPFGPEDDPDGLPPLGERPPEIAHEPAAPSIHELPPLGDAVWHQLPVTSPAATTAAAAGGLHPPEAPPPLPDHQPCDCPCHEDEWFPECPRCDQPPPLPEGTLWAPADTGFAKWESDTFVGGLQAIRGHGGTAGMEAEI